MSLNMDMKNGTRILLVEDDRIIAMWEERLLINEGFLVVHAGSGEEAIRQVETSSPPFDLILMDIDLGKGMDGTEAAEIILRTHDVPVVFMSFHTEPEIVSLTDKITSYGYILKNSGKVVITAGIKMALKLFESHKKLISTTAHFRALIESPKDFIWSVEPENFSLLNFNHNLYDYFSAMNGLSIRVGMKPREIFRTEELALKWRGHYLRLINEGPYSIEYETDHGDIILDLDFNPIEINGKMVAISVFGKDVTNRKRREAETLAARELYTKAFMLGPSAMGLIDLSHKGRFVDCNPALEMITGYSRSELIGRNPAEMGFFAEHDERDTILETLEHEGRISDRHCVIRNKSGEIATQNLCLARVDVRGSVLVRARDRSRQ
jgi:PAS domain S-box-containing protein